MAVKQTAGRDALGEFAPKFAQLNDDVLFGEVWSREGQFPLKMRSIVTVTALINTFLESYDFAGKTVIPFATSGGSGMGKTVAALRGSCAGTILPGGMLNGKHSADSLRRWAEEQNR